MTIFKLSNRYENYFNGIPYIPQTFNSTIAVLHCSSQVLILAATY